MNFYIQSEPRKLMKSKRFARVAIGGSFTLATTHSGELFGWGTDFLNMGKGLQSNEPVLIEVPGGKRIVDVSAGLHHAAVIDENGHLYTWGDGGNWFKGGGQLGHGSRNAETHPRLVEWLVKYGAKVKQVSCGGQHTVVLTEEQEIFTFGVGEFGRLGTGSTNDALEPSYVESLSEFDIIQIAAGYDHSLALGRTGNIYGWGRNNMGQVHGLSNLDMYALEIVPFLIFNTYKDEEGNPSIEKEFIQVSAGHGLSAAVSKGGDLFVWGTRIAYPPRQYTKKLFGGKKVIQVAVGGDSSKAAVAAITEDGALWTFGDSSSNLLGKANISGKQLVPLKIDALKSVASLATGLGHHIAAFVNVKNE